jgi:hypothetical protein
MIIAAQQRWQSCFASNETRLTFDISSACGAQEALQVIIQPDFL